MIKEAYEGYTATLTSMADIRNEVLEISQDPNKTDKEKQEQLSTLGKKYNQLAQARELFTDTKTFGSLYAALKGSSIFGSSERKRKFNEVTEKAKDNITKKKGSIVTGKQLSSLC